jgi:hypothetical protein
MSSFNDIEKQRIKKIVGGFCRKRIPDHQRTQVKLFYEVKNYEVKIIESRSSSPNSHIWIDTPIARLLYDPDSLHWHLYWMRGTGRWQKYNGLEPTNSLNAVIDEIAIDPFLLFWG